MQLTMVKAGDGESELRLPEENPFKDLFNPKTQERIPPPRGLQAMEKHPYCEYYMESSAKEKMENLGWKSYVEVLRSEVPKGVRILRPVTVYDHKYNAAGEIYKFKTRVCLDGSRTEVDPTECYEHICNFGIFRMLMAMAARYRLDVVQTDVKNFYLQARLPPDKQYYTEIPEGWAENDPKTHVAKVLAAWYGLKEAAKISGDQMKETMESLDLIENKHFPKVFTKWDGDDVIICAYHADDALWFTNNTNKLDQVLDAVEKKFKLERNYNPSKILGCELQYDKDAGVMKLHQGSYVNSKLKEVGFKDFKHTTSPGYIPPKLDNPEFKGNTKVPASKEEIRKFQKLIGVHMWGLQTDPSSSYVVAKLARSMLNPQKEDWAQMKKLNQYKATNPEMGCVWRAADPPVKLVKGMSMDCLTFYADADLGGNHTNKNGKSTSGYCAHLGETGMFDWKSKKQTCVCQSSCEAEVYASKQATCQAIWLRNGLVDMGFTFEKPTPICQDNQSAIAQCVSDKHHSRARHFRLHVNLLRDCYNKRITCYPWVPTTEMKGDLFNKAHGATDHQRLCEANAISNLPIRLLDPKPKPLVIFGRLEAIQKQKKVMDETKQ